MSGAVNYAGIACGGAGAGKTTLARQLVRQHLQERPGGIVLAHDPVGQYGRAPFEDAAAARAAIVDAQRRKTSLPRVLPIGGDSERITELAIELGRRANRAQHVPRPILVVYDEASLLSGSGSTWIGRVDQQSLAIRRHLGVMSLYLLQRPQQLPEPFWALATDCYLFAGPSTTARRAEELFLLERGELEQIRDLPRFRYLHVRR